MTAERSAGQELSKCLFGQYHRLAVMVAIAKAPDGRVNPTDLATDLRLPQSALQAPLRDLVEAGLLQREPRSHRNFYKRVKSLAWEWVLELEKQAHAAELKSNVRQLGS
jgi:DNA-binding MarR family transcriptional regulator